MTASHNPEDDNGLKMIDPTGGMLAQSVEVIAEVKQVYWFNVGAAVSTN